jgi:hypothetical protein
MRTKSLYIFILVFTALLSVNSNAQDKQDKNATGSVGPVKFSGLMFGDLYYNANSINAANKDINGWQFRRIYITADYTINDDFSSRFRLDVDQSALSSNNKIIAIAKDAWLKWKNVFSGSDLVVGISPTPAYDASEGAWGYRSLEKTIMDYFGIVSSRDLGIDLKGRIDEKGVASYWVKLGDNSGNSPESNKYKRYYGQLKFKPNDNLLFTVYGDFASYAQRRDPFDGQLKNNSAFVAAGFVGYKQGNLFALGLEGFIKSQQNNFSPNGAASSLQSQNGFGISLWGRTMLAENIGVVARYDSYDPNSNSVANNDQQGLFIAAVDFKVAPKVSVMPGVEVRTLQGASDSDVTPRVTFFWEF